MYCLNCGSSIDDNAKFCPYCGGKNNPNYDAFKDLQGSRVNDMGTENVGGTNIFSVLAFVFSLLGSFVGIPFVVLGFIRAKKCNGKGRTLCILSIIFLVFWLVIFVLCLPGYIAEIKEIIETYSQA